jgi:hypothetical protein
MLQCSEWRDFAFLPQSEPGVKARDEKLPLVPRDAKPSSELRNEFWKSADGAVPCDKLSSHFGEFSATFSPSRAAAAARRLAELSKAQLQSLALKSARHVYLCECGAFLHAQILRLESMRICPAACRAGPV